VLERGEAWADYPIAITVDDFGDKFSLIAHTDRRLSGSRVLEYLSCALQALTEALENAPRTPVHELAVVPAAERRRILEDFNGTEVLCPIDRLIQEEFEAQVQRAPDAVAVVCEGERLTYSELSVRANQLAWYLRTKGIGPDERVGIYTERSLEMIVGILGVLKSGGAYVPLDPRYPAERIAYMLADAAPRIVLIQERLRTQLPVSDVKPIALDSQWDEICRQSSTNITSGAVGAHPGDLAYVIYTSGSTGKPKGVMIEHRNVLLLWHGLNRLYDQVGRCLRIALNAPINFDASVQQLVQLLSGRTLYLVPDDTRRDPERMLRFIEEHEIEGIDCTPSQLNSWVRMGLLNRARLKLRMILVGGEAIEYGLWRALAGSETIQCYNVYGPTECTVDTTAAPIAGKGTEPHIGQPMRNRRIYILDDHKRIVPIGISGEIYIGGAGVGRGYLNRVELTAERFLKDPFSSDQGDRMYRTGDLGRWRADGTIEYLGRNDQQVKVRGFRIELGEIEAQLANLPLVKEAVVVAREDIPGEKRLAAYVTPKDSTVPPDSRDLRVRLKASLPDYMVPSAIVVLERLPMTPSGKLDRRALPVPEFDAYVRHHYEAPRGETERALAGIWQELLHLDRVGRNDNFFELGGHSLLIVQMLQRLRRVGLSTEVRRVFEFPTLSDLSGALTATGVSQVEVPPNRIPPGCETITPEMLPLVRMERLHIEQIAQSVPGGVANIKDIYPLAPLQEGILFHHLLAGPDCSDPYIFMVMLAFQSREVLDEFIAAIQHVIDRHDALRTAMRWEGLPQPVQVVHRRAAMPVEAMTLDSDQDPVDQLQAQMTPKGKMLDLSNAPLMHLRIAPDPKSNRWYALLQLHHVVCDNMSLDIVLQEVNAVLEGRATCLPGPVAYRSHVAKMLLRHQTLDHEAYFRSKLGDIEEPTAAFGLTEALGDAADTESAEETIDESLARRVQTQARALGVTPATLFHSAWSLVLSHVSGRNDVVFGSVLLGRSHGGADALRTLGLCINTLPLRLKLAGTTPKGLVEQTQREIMYLMTHEDAPLAIAQRCSSIPSGTTLFSTLLNYRHKTLDLKSQFVPSTGLSVLVARSWTNYPILISVDERREGFSLSVQTDRRVDPQRVIGYMSEALKALTDALEAGSDTEPLSMSILPAVERARILRTFNATEAPYSKEVLVHELFEEQVRRTPEAVAVLHEGMELTYAELNHRANQLARYLRTHGIRPDQAVGICVDRSAEMVIGLLGILKAGGAYLPLDPNYPTERLQHMLEDAAPPIVLTQGELLSELPATGADTVVLDETLREIRENIRENLPARELSLHAKNLVYVIYTSGSTGRPKGTAMPHRAMVNLIEWHRSTFAGGPGTRVLQFAALSFDVAFQETFTTLCSGGTLVLVDEWIRRDAGELMGLLCKGSIQRLFLPPLMLQALAEYARSTGVVPETLADVITAGEQLRISPEVQAFFKRLPKCALHNHYGPAETHVVTALTLTGDPDGWPTLPAIGRPISNTQIYVLDADRRVVPIGVTGEIYIGGIGVSNGYLGKPELTAQRFIEDPFSADPDARLYRTGDLGRWRADGMLEYLGRTDFQIKIRGYRVELGEIEAQLARHEQVKDVAVIAREDDAREKRLVAYITLRDKLVPSVAGLRAHLKAALPDYMIPSALVFLESLPLTPNGKLDRRALPAPALDSYVRQQYEEPKGEIEKILEGIWQELLHVDRVGRNDNFFELGGHSLLVIKAIVRINEALGCQLHVRDIYQSPSLRELADRAAGISAADEFIDLSNEAKLDEDLCILNRTIPQRLPSC